MVVVQILEVLLALFIIMVASSDFKNDTLPRCVLTLLASILIIDGVGII